LKIYLAKPIFKSSKYRIHFP